MNLNKQSNYENDFGNENGELEKELLGLALIELAEKPASLDGMKLANEYFEKSKKEL